MFQTIFSTRRGGCALLVLLVSLLVACDGAKETTTLRIGTNVWPGYEPLYLAASLDYIKEDQVRLVEYSSASQVVRAFRNDIIDAAALTLDEVLILAQYGLNLEIVLVMDISNGGDVILARPELSDMQALKNHRVGVENTALGAFVLTRALQLSDMKIDDVNIVSLEVGEHENAYLSGDIDAAVTFDPVRSRLLAKGARPVFDSRQLPGEIVDVLVVRREYALENEAVVAMLVESWYQTLDYMNSNSEVAMKKISERLHLSPSQTLASYEGILLPDKNENQRLLQNSPEPLLLGSTKNLLKVMTERNLLNNHVNVSALFEYIHNHPNLHQ